MALSDRLQQLRTGQSEPKRPVPKGERVGPVKYLRGVRDELKKVSWPKRDQVVRGTIQVLVVSAVFVVVLGGLDLLFQLGLKEVLREEAGLETPAATEEAVVPEGALDGSEVELEIPELTNEEGSQ